MKELFDDYVDYEAYPDFVEEFEEQEDKSIGKQSKKAVKGVKKAQETSAEIVKPAAGALEFRALRPDEIDVRIQSYGQVSSGKWQARLLLYQKARVPAQILDETVGPLRWQVIYGETLNRCKILIYDPELKEWICKENIGSQSDLESEADKSTASDAFKRAASYWGIGRELYSAADIVTDKIKIIDLNKPGYNNKAYMKCYDKFEVTEIETDQNKKILHLVIRNITQNCIAYKI